MKPVLTFFLDALKPESIQFMPFLNSLAHKRRMRAEFGHSVTCHPSMYSGVHPNKHLQWFVWKYDPLGTPFKWARIFKYLGFIDNLPTRYFLHKYTRQYRSENTAWFGVPLLVNLPMKYWPYFNVVEDRSWDEPGYLQEYPTAFDILRKHNISFEVVGMTQGAGDEFVQIGGHKFTEIHPWTYIFLGSVDSYSHRYGQDAPEAIERMRALDQLMEAKYKEYSQRVNDFDVFVFSDHGHILSDKRVDIHKVFRQKGHNLRKFIHLVESNFIRFWFRNDSERAVVEPILSSIEEGFILEDHHLKRYHLDMPDNRYGDLVFYLDAPYLFTKTVWGFSRKQKSMHGYLPDYPDSDGIFLSQRPLVEGTHVELVDVLPTLLSSLNVPVPDYVDGRILWA
jgi:predicted AlkP superfamily pyrophosphatase or phosphodiesterase